jgi:hypothetical protein
MRKRTINLHSEADSSSDEKWLNLDALAQVEITSESAEHPIESALLHDHGSGWRAAQPGKQTIRIIFNQPLSLGLIFLRFEEEKQERTQEFVLRMILEVEGQRLSRNIVRQQYTFSPPTTTAEVESYSVRLNGVMALELEIVPSIGGGSAYASLSQMRIA